MRGRSSEIPNPTAPTGRNLPAKGVSPGCPERELSGPERDVSTADRERIDVDAISPIHTAHPTTIRVREEDRGIHPETKLSDDGFPGTRCRSAVAVDASHSGTVNARSAVPGLTPFAGRLRPVGAVGSCIFGVDPSISPSLSTNSHALRWQISPRWGLRELHMWG